MATTTIKRSVLFAASSLAMVACMAFTSAVQAQPAVDNCPRKRICLEVVANNNGCPVYTRYEGVKDKVPVLAKSTARRMIWYIVNEAGAQQQIEFKVYFDPFKKPELHGTGMAESQRLDKNVPVNVDFKYTVVVDSCEPLDPIIRIIR